MACVLSALLADDTMQLRASLSSVSTALVCFVRVLCLLPASTRYWADEDPHTAERTDALHIPLALNEDEIETLLAAGVGWGGRDAGYAPLCDALSGIAHDIAYGPDHIALYMHRDGFLQRTHPALVAKIVTMMRSQVITCDLVSSRHCALMCLVYRAWCHSPTNI